MLADICTCVINIVFPRQRNNKSTAKRFLAGYSTLNRPAVPLTNKLLAFFHTRNRFSLISFLLVLLLVSGLVLASTLKWTKCAGESGFLRTFLMALRHLMGFNADYLEDLGDGYPMECLAVAASADFFALLLQIAFVGLCTSCVMKTHSILEVTSSVATASRDGVKRIAVRLAHPQGHLLTQCQGEFVWLRPRQTAEGEQFDEQCTLDLCTMPTAIPVPFTFSHVIDARSPLFPYRHDLANTPGRLMFYFTGVDFVLDCTAIGFQTFAFSQIRQNHKFSDIMLVNPTEAKLAGTKSKIDLGRFHETREIDTNQLRGLELRLIAEASAAARERPDQLPRSTTPASTTLDALLLPPVSRSNLAELEQPGADLQRAESPVLRVQDVQASDFQHRIERERVHALQASFELEMSKITEEYKEKLQQLTSKLAIELHTRQVPRAERTESWAEVTRLEESAARTECKREGVFSDCDTLSANVEAKRLQPHHWLAYQQVSLVVL